MDAAGKASAEHPTHTEERPTKGACDARGTLNHAWKCPIGRTPHAPPMQTVGLLWLGMTSRATPWECWIIWGGGGGASAE